MQPFRLVLPLAPPPPPAACRLLPAPWPLCQAAPSRLRPTHRLRDRSTRAAAALQTPSRTPVWRAARSRPPTDPARRRPTASPAAAATEPADGEQQVPAALAPPPSPQELAALANRPEAFAAALRRLAERGSGCTEAHVVAAWAAQRRAPALRVSADGTKPLQAWQRQRQEAALAALAALERVTRQQLVALAPDQLGFVARCGWLGMAGRVCVQCVGWAAEQGPRSTRAPTFPPRTRQVLRPGGRRLQAAARGRAGGGVPVARPGLQRRRPR